jgi:hypothetical protein
MSKTKSVPIAYVDSHNNIIWNMASTFRKSVMWVDILEAVPPNYALIYAYFL